MKQLISALTILVLMFAVNLSAGTANATNVQLLNCNMSTESTNLYPTPDNPVITFETDEVPNGQCQNLGALGKGQTLVDCREVAQSMGFDCYQITKFSYDVHSVDSGDLLSTKNICWACLK